MSEPEEVEVIEEVEAVDVERKIRVYKDSGDFILTLPPGCRMTFGYFNPAAPKFANNPDWQQRPSDVAKATCLRIYRGAGDKEQLAAFLGIKGFRDETIKLEKIVEKVTVERRFVQDGDDEEWSGSKAVEMRALPEAEF